MRFAGVLLVISGLLLACWGTVAAFDEPRRRAVAGSIAAPAGVLIALFGAILVCVPGFLAR